ncbi:hypothetical protein PoB_000917500 [Plakobranchus ocellatus]|uniref:Uncharacterized protein n=1 Tax=Plakobranchus ocellatus TaxID=259542 RepID=A0AAV3YHW4_9GAST|nr:hypothetical protein PoB_000917500 [Plakobranchus ocellatus]
MHHNCNSFGSSNFQPAQHRNNSNNTIMKAVIIACFSLALCIAVVVGTDFLALVIESACRGPSRQPCHTEVTGYFRASPFILAATTLGEDANDREDWVNKVINI